jgi:endonuclease YncB( thermonuclease family)
VLILVRRSNAQSIDDIDLEASMPFVLIKGTFRPETGVPDGDTVRFEPDDANLLFRLKQTVRPPKINQDNGTTALRYEGIDAMEKAARLPFSADATRANLEFLGRPDVNPDLRGHVLARQLDPNGRPISFVFLGDALDADGASVFLSPEGMRESVNFKLLRAGHAYPLFYDTLFDDLRESLIEAAVEAREMRRGLWSADVTNSGAQWAGEASLGTLEPLFPKLWRRLDEYTRDDAFEAFANTLGQFHAFLQMRDDRVKLSGTSHFTGLDNILQIEGDILRMVPRPEEVVFRA